MGKKRAHVDAVLSTTGGSSMFGQDMGDLEEIETNKEVIPNETTHEVEIVD
jgi:hypothetical protein